MRAILTFTFVLCLTFLIAAPVNAEPNLAGKQAYADPAEAAKTIDYQVQGEYVGEVREGDETMRFGLQVIALGNGKFTAVVREGGLPGDGWDGEKGEEIPGQLDGDKAVFKTDKHEGVIQDGKLTITDIGDGSAVGAGKKVMRKSKTLGAKPPKSAVVLFDGKKETLEKQWKSGAKMTDDGLLMQGVTSAATFGDHKLHIEFRLPFQPFARGQGRGNSGVYLQARYETQMLDSFGLAGKNNECGGIYTVKDPDVNMCYTPLSWQTYDIDFTAARFDDAGKKIKNARMTVYHNGVKIHDNVEVPNPTRASPLKTETPEPGPVYLQNHGNPVRYRNIWVEKK